MKPNCPIRIVSLLVLASLVLTGQALTAQVARQETVIPLKNWAVPLYWQPNQAETPSSGRAQPEIQFSATQVSTSALTFIAVTPCRLVDTRGTTNGNNFVGVSPFGGPSIAAGITVPFPVQASTLSSISAPAPCGVIPSIAQAYSFNITVVPQSGGMVDYISLWPVGGTKPFVSTLDDPQGAIVSNAAIVPAGTPNGGINFFNFGPATTDVIIDMNGFFAAPTDLLFNTAIGAGALANNTTGGQNTASGSSALASNTTGNGNTATGQNALQSNTNGTSNTATGQNALQNNTAGVFNTASGSGALQFNTTGDDNTASGYNALQSNTTGGANTATGVDALQNNTTGNDNTASGVQALGFNTTGSFNTAFGITALLHNNGSNNTASGFQTMQSNTTGNNNTAAGVNSLYFNTTGADNTANGFQALQNNSTASDNTAIGSGTLQSNTTGINNTATGFQALQTNATGDDNTASGFQTLQNNTTGVSNTATGSGALLNNTTGNSNTAVGFEALKNNTAGFNTAVGSDALENNTTGIFNIGVGQLALASNTTGSSNIAIGHLAGSMAGASSGNIFISNEGSGGDSGVIRIGDSQTSTYIKGIWNNAPNSTNLLVCIDSGGQLGTSGCGSTPSSRRFKDQITDMGDSSSKLLQLRPVTFFYKPQYDDGTHSLQYGLIAEEVANVYPDMVEYDKDGQPAAVKYQSLAPMLLNEVQKQNAQLRQEAADRQTENLSLRNEIQIQQEANRKLEDRLAALEALLSSETPAATRPPSSQ